MTLRSKQILFPLVALGLFVGIAALFMANKKEQESKPPKSNDVFVRTTLAQLQPHQFLIESQGLVTAKNNTTVVAQVSGEVIHLSDTFNKGGWVSKGELLAKIDPFNYQVKLEQAKANLANVRASFILERAQGRVAEAEWANISRSEPSDLGLRKPQQEQALAAVKAAEAGLRQAQKDLERTSIMAPYSAIIQERNISLGSYVNMGGAIAQLLDASIAEVRLPITQRDFSFLDNDGLDAEVTLTSTIGREQKNWQARIIRTERFIDSSTRMIHLVASVLQPYTDAKKLKFGTYVNASIKGKTFQSALTIERQILREDQIPLLIEGELQFKPVSIIRHEGKYSIIGAGIREGDRIITSALEYPTDGMKIHWEGDQSEPKASNEPDTLRGE